MISWKRPWRAGTARLRSKLLIQSVKKSISISGRRSEESTFCDCICLRSAFF